MIFISILFSHIFPSFSKILDNFPKYSIFYHLWSISFKNPGWFFQIIHLFFKTPGDFSFFRSSGLRISSILFYPACNFQNSCIFPKSNSNLPIFQSNGIQSARFCFSWGSHLLRGATKSSRASSSQHRTLLPRWYYVWFKNFSRMFSDHLSDCGLELASAVGKLTVNGNLIHALAERWNPRTCTFWFPWGEMTATDGWIFRDHGILPEPAGQPGDPLEQQFFINVKGLDPKDAVARMTGRKSWPLIEENGNEYVSLIEIYRQYGEFAEVSSLSRTARERIQHAMVLCTVGLAFFPDGQNYVDVRIVQLLRRWGSRQTSRLSIAMAALAFLYRGLTRFTLGESILVEGCTYALQSWFLQHGRPELVRSDTMARSSFQLCGTGSWSIICKKKKWCGTILIENYHLPDTPMHMARDSSYLVHSSALLSSRAVCSTVFSETEAHRDAAAIRSRARSSTLHQHSGPEYTILPDMTGILSSFSLFSPVLVSLLIIKSGGRLSICPLFLKSTIDAINFSFNEKNPSIFILFWFDDLA